MLQSAAPIPTAVRDLFPEPVLAASDSYAEEGLADQALAEAKQVAEHAADVDTAAARDALAAGKRPPKRPSPLPRRLFARPPGLSRPASSSPGQPSSASRTCSPSTATRSSPG